MMTFIMGLSRGGLNMTTTATRGGWLHRQQLHTTSRSCKGHICRSFLIQHHRHVLSKSIPQNAFYTSQAISTNHLLISNTGQGLRRHGRSDESSSSLNNRRVDRVHILKHGVHRSQHQLAEQKVETGESLSSSTSITTAHVANLTSPSATPLPPLSQPPMPPKRRPPKKMSNYVFSKFLSFVQSYQDIMEKKFPQAMNVYRVFIVGFKDFSKELADYVKLKTKAMLSSDGVLDLTRQELDVYYRMPNEIFRVAPTLLLSALPGFQYIVFPFAYKFPKQCLSSHFWSIQQKSQFAVEFQKKRLVSQRPVLRYLQSNVESIRDEKLQEVCKEILFKIGSGSQPTIREIRTIRPLFESDPFSIKAMHGPHIKSLCRLHGMHTWYFNRRRVYDRAEMLYVMDVTLVRDGIFNLKTEEVKSACFLRGLNASNTSHEDMVEFLQQWMSVSSAVQPHSYSLLLHLPVLLAYNNPSNWALLHEQK